jgi:uncharacterized membrane protein YfbV (UPF0208 family)
MADDEISLRRWSVRQLPPILILSVGLVFVVYRGDTIGSACIGVALALTLALKGFTLWALRRALKREEAR